MTPLFSSSSVCFSVVGEVGWTVVSTAMQTVRLVDAFMMYHCQLTTQHM